MGTQIRWEYVFPRTAAEAETAKSRDTTERERLLHSKFGGRTREGGRAHARVKGLTVTGDREEARSNTGKKASLDAAKTADKDTKTNWTGRVLLLL